MKIGIGITTYKDEKSLEKTPAEVVKALTPFFREAEIKEAWGVYKGVKEPSAQVIFNRPLNAVDMLHIKQVLKKYNQESALVYEYGLGSPAIEFNQIYEYEELQKDILAFTNGKFGEFMTYLPEEHKAFILCVEDFGMNCEEFQKQALLVAHKFKGKLFKSKNRVIK